MNLFNMLRGALLDQITALQAEGALPSGLAMDAVEVTPPREAAHGDMATNAAMVLAAKAGMRPRDIAEKLVEKLQKLPSVTSVEIAGPGFINLRFAPAFWQAVIPEILKAGTHYGDAALGGGEKVNVEYVSANPTGPMHVGHARGAVFGDALAALLEKAGYDVTREYYINDAGAQIDKLADSAFHRYREALGEAAGEVPEGLYPGDYLVPAGQALKAKYGESLRAQPREEWLPIVRRFVVDAMMALVREDLALLGIKHDVFTSEWELAQQGKVQESFDALDKKGHIYTGVLPPPKGKVIEDWEPRELVLFRASQFGDDGDRPMKKADGQWAYIAPDIAYHYDKLQRGFNKMVLVLGADHTGYQKRLQAAVAALSDGKAELQVKLCQIVKFLRGGQPAKMSKRAGTFVTVRDVIDEVGKDVLRFIMLTRKNDAPLDFDVEKVTEQSKDNPVFYVQYAHARVFSVLRMAAEQAPEALALSEGDASPLAALLTAPQELELIRLLAVWPRLVEQAALAYEPHRIAFFAQELAAAFHGLWHAGNDDLSLRFIQKHDIKQTAARLVLVRAVACVIASALEVLGVEPVQEM